MHSAKDAVCIESVVSRFLHRFLYLITDGKVFYYWNSTVPIWVLYYAHCISGVVTHRLTATVTNREVDLPMFIIRPTYVMQTLDSSLHWTLGARP